MICGLKEAYNSILNEYSVEQYKKYLAKQKLLSGVADNNVLSRDLTTQKNLVLECKYKSGSDSYLCTILVPTIVVAKKSFAVPSIGYDTKRIGSSDFDYLCDSILKDILDEGLNNEVFRVDDLIVSFYKVKSANPNLTKGYLLGILNNEIVFIYGIGSDVDFCIDSISFQKDDNRLCISFDAFYLSIDFDNFSIRRSMFYENMSYDKHL